MFVFGLGTLPMLLATHSTVNWLRHHIGRLRLRQMNGALMMLSGVAVIAVPLAMSSMHGGHGHGGHAAMMSEDGTAMHMTHEQHEMSHDMNHAPMDEHEMHSGHEMPMSDDTDTHHAH